MKSKIRLNHWISDDITSPFKVSLLKIPKFTHSPPQRGKKGWKQKIHLYQWIQGEKIICLKVPHLKHAKFVNFPPLRGKKGWNRKIDFTTELGVKKQVDLMCHTWKSNQVNSHHDNALLHHHGYSALVQELATSGVQCNEYSLKRSNSRTNLVLKYIYLFTRGTKLLANL